jgi:hypothetical protein
MTENNPKEKIIASYNEYVANKKKADAAIRKGKRLRISP